MSKSRLSVSKKQIVILAVLVIFVFLMMDLNSRLTVLSRQNEQLGIIQLEVTGFKKTDFFLNTQIAFSSSDAGVEGYIRVFGSQIKPGDIPIVPMPAKNLTPTPYIPPKSTPEHVDNWVIWRVLLVGK